MQILARANYSKKAQLKIQQMAFMLVALMIFFGIIILIYFAIALPNLQEKAQDLRDKEAREIVLKMSGVPEFAFTSSTDCQNCIDLDKVFQLKQKILADKKYENFWNLDYLAVERLYPNDFEGIECDSSNYPNCGEITIIPASGGRVAVKTAFASLASWNPSLGGVGGFDYDFGRIKVSGEDLSNE